MSESLESGSPSPEMSSQIAANMEAIEPLLTLALGASEEVNTSANSRCNIIVSPTFLQKNAGGDSIAKPTFIRVNSGEISNFSQIPNLQTTMTTTDSVAQQVQDMNPERTTMVALNAEQLQYLQTESITNVGNPETGDGAPLHSFVVIEQSVLDQISGFLKNSAASVTTMVTTTSNEAATSTVSTSSSTEHPVEETTDNQPVESSGDIYPSETAKNCQAEMAVASATISDNEQTNNAPDDDDDWIDTKAMALKLTEELRRYHIPQAVFAKKVLNRSQGTLSDLLRKPKPWNEMRLGKAIFKRMKEWLELPEVKRIPQLRMEAAKELDSRAKRSNSESDVEAAPSKKIRRQFTETQKRTLFAIFKETKKPTKDMQKAVAEELGLDLNSVANFFMNARRRHTDA